MPQAQPMTFNEKLALSCKAALLHKAGDEEGYIRTMRSIPLPPYLAKWAKNHMGPNFLIESGWNLSEAEAEFGEDWLSK
ncbi:hypothetical protein FACS1894147_08980 [Spirochaetia bacterium]|nr:hypothetical protein FACS1894147_08980 [Spirochaetia bacterium]